ncbi:phytoene desaturase family protein, partial [Deinococcus planocerae]|uniref:phytoene desaturase family protein n=1 Tax=Deinococcus planocerae TaxID=1737569 RepID=UPI0011AFC38E
MGSTSKFTTDAVVIGSGHNGLAAAITLAQAGLEVTLLEAQSSVGGGLHTSELTLPGFHHDLCSGVHPMAAASPFFSALPLASFGLEWVSPTIPLAHPLGEEAVFLHTSLQETLAGLGNDAEQYSSLIEGFNRDFPMLKSDLMGPMLHLPRHPFRMIHFGVRAILPAHAIAHHYLKGHRLKALFAGLAGHSGIPFHALGSSAIAMMLTAAAHHHNWPFPRGGAQQLAFTLARYFQSLGGKIQTETRVDNLQELPRSRITIFDLGPNEIFRIVGTHAPTKLTTTTKRYRYGPGVYKIDYALREPVPWKTNTINSAGTTQELHLHNDGEALPAEKIWECLRHRFWGSASAFWQMSSWPFQP